MALRGALRKKIEEKKANKKGEKAPPGSFIVHKKSRLDWFLDILTAVFVIGVVINSGFNVGNVFKQNPQFDAMQSYLLFAILFQLVKIGRKYAS